MVRMEKTVYLGESKENFPIFCTVRIENDCLSISGTNGPSAGQIDMELRDQQETIQLADGWTRESTAQFFQVWKDWHLNDMIAGCEHQEFEKRMGHKYESYPRNLDGLCPECGYFYGSRWNTRTLPQTVIAFLAALPEAVGPKNPADKFMADHGLEFRAVLVGNDCPMFCEDHAKDKYMDQIDVYPRRSHIHGKHYRCTVSAKGRGHVSFDFWNSYADEEQNYAVTHRYEHHRMDAVYKGKKRITVVPYDLLACLTKDDPGSFSNFCGEFGYDDDSRKAEDVYRAVQAEWRKVQKFFTADELEIIRGIQ